MGVVYRAVDTKLDRPVALKFLPDHLLNDQEIRKRFEREAKAAAALDHPNICTVYEIDEAEGQTFIAMALIEGESLDKQIEQGPLPIEEILAIAKQVADGLEAAHEKGIYHRDIKPENIMVDAKGRVTIMDFGLAQLTEASRLTKTDQTMGTVFYMSPEQTEGSGTDHRTDIWALGVVIYEMVTAQRPFKGDYDKAVMYSILNEEPEPMTGLRSGVPMELEVFAGKCLAKDPVERYRKAADVAVDLTALRKKLGSSDARPHSLVAATPVPSQAAAARGRWAWLPWALFAITALSLAAMMLSRPGAEERRMVEVNVAPPEGQTFPDTGFQGPPVISPDGSKLAFVSDDSLWVRPLDSDEPRRLPSTEDATYPFWSPRSDAIAFFAGAKLRIAPAGGGPVREVCDAPEGRGGAWRDDDVIIFSPEVFSALYRVPENGGDAVQVTARDAARSEETHRMPRFLPDGRFLYVTQYVQPGRDQLCVGAVPDGEEPTKSTAEDCFLRTDSRAWYVPALESGGPGHLLYVNSGSLLAHAFDPESRRVLGDATLLALNVDNGGLRRAGDFSVSANGILTFGSAKGSSQLHRLVWFDRDTREVTQAWPSGRYVGQLDLLSGGDAAVVTSITQQSTGRLTRIDLDSGASRDFVPDANSYFDGFAVAAPDGEEILFNRDGQGSNRLVRRPARGVGSEQILIESGQKLYPTEWVGGPSPFLLYQRGARNSGSDVWLLPLEGGDPRPLIATDASELGAVVSPDGRWVAYVSDRSGREEVFVQGMEGPSGSSQISTDGGYAPRWRSDGRELFYLSLDAVLYATSVRATSGFEASPPRPLSDEPIFVSRDDGTPYHGTPYDVAPDGERFLGLAPADHQSRGPQLLTVVLNWQAMLD